MDHFNDERIASALQQLATEGSKQSEVPPVETFMVRRLRRPAALVGVGGLVAVLVLVIAFVVGDSAPSTKSTKDSTHVIAAPNQVGLGQRSQPSRSDVAKLASLTSVPQNELNLTPDPADPGWSCKVALNTLFNLPVPLSDLEAMPASQAEAELATVPKSQMWGVRCQWTGSSAPTTPGPLEAIKGSSCNVTAGSPPTTAPSNANNGLQPCSASSDPSAASNQVALDQLFQSLGWGSPSWLSGQAPPSPSSTASSGS